MSLEARERVALAIDTSETEEAQRLASVAHAAGARFIKLGLEIESATSWAYCSGLADDYGLDWIADAKLDDKSTTVAKAVKNISRKDRPPFAITIHTRAGFDAMRAAKAEAGNIKMLGVSELTSIPAIETKRRYGRTRLELVMQLARDAVYGHLDGVVAGPREVGFIKSDIDTKDLFTLIPGTRSIGVDTYSQPNSATPADAIRDGADLLVIGIQITQGENPLLEYDEVVAEIEGAMLSQ